MSNLRALFIGILMISIIPIGCNEDDPQIRITSISFDTATVEVVEGTTINLDDYLTIEGEDADQAEIVFTSDNEEVVTVSGNTLSAVGVGEAEVEATETNTNRSATIDVTVIAEVISVTGVSLDNEVLELEIGETEQLTATISPEDATNQEVEWSVEFPSDSKNSDADPTSIATVSDEGLVTAVSPGNVDIVVITKDGEFTAVASLTVTGIPVTGITLNEEAIDLEVEETFQLTATVSPSNATEQGVIWSVDFPSEAKTKESDPEDIATVSDEGLVTAVSAGDVVVTATTKDGEFTASAQVNVSNIAVTGVSISPDPISIAGSTTYQLEANISPQNAYNQGVTWELYLEEVPGDPLYDEISIAISIDASYYAEIDSETGEITTVRPCDGCGLMVMVTTDDGEFTDELPVEITYVAATSISLYPSSFTVDPGSTQQMTATISPDNATYKDVSWSLEYNMGLCDVPPVSNYASVSSEGLVTGIAAFEACNGINVIASSDNDDGVEGTANFTVNPILATGVTIVDGDGIEYGAAIELDRCDYTTYQLYVKVSPDDASDQTVTWSVTSGTGVMVNSSSGLMTLDSEGGTARITATANDGSGETDYIDVTVNPCI